MKAIPTLYKGTYFRSRLEARWAVFFDSLGLKWEYEKEGFDLGGGLYYLPDFWLPEVKMWAEVKPAEWEETSSFGPDGDSDKLNDQLKIASLAITSKRPVLMLIGVPENKPYYAVIDNPADAIVYYCLTRQYHDYPRTEGRFYSQPGGPDDSYYDDTELAASRAKSAKFEHGVGGEPF